MPVLSIYLLGPPRVEAGGKVITISRRKALGLLAYLCGTRRSHTRESLASLFWPDAGADRAHAALRNILWVLGQTPIGASLLAEHDRIGLMPAADLWIDVEEFHARLSRCRAHIPKGLPVPPECVLPLTEAVELYRDHFMAGFHLHGSAEFEEWQAQQGEMLRNELAGALAWLVRHHRSRREHDQAVAHACRWWALDRFNEPVLRLVMELYARAGQRGAALEQYKKGQKILKDELGQAPELETVALFRRILSGELGRDSAVERDRPPAHNLPVQNTSFVDRVDELAEIRRFMGEPGHGLLTLVGMGGNGKTRLAIQAAAEQVDRFRDGVFLVPLSHVSGASSLVPAMAEVLLGSRPALGGQVQLGETAGAIQQTEQLLGYLREKQMLLILDNMEHLLDGAGTIEEILRVASGVKILATSRARLALAGEWVLEIKGLSCPESKTGSPAAEESCAVRLFVQRAEQVVSGFSPGAQDLEAIARICRTVEGNPLGIELAAAWVNVLTPGDVIREIGRSMDFLETRQRDVPERHRSLRAVFEQSWACLSPEERTCYRRLAVFHGGFTREAAEAIAEATLPILAGLMEKSLLRRSGAGRYEIHEVLRQFAGEHFQLEAQDHHQVGERHSLHFLGVLRRMGPRLKGGDQIAALRECAQELENINEAWLWAARRGRVDWLIGTVVGLFLYYDIRSRFLEGAEVFRAAAAALGDRTEDAGRVLMGELMAAEGWFLRYTEPSRSRSLVRQGHDLLESCGEGVELALAKILAAIVDVWPGTQDLAAELRCASEIFEARADRWGLALSLEVLSFNICAESPTEAMACARRSLKLRRQLGDSWGVTLALYILGLLAEQQGMYALAKRRYQESLDRRRELGEDMDGLAACLSGLGRVSRRLGDREAALGFCEESLTLAREMGNRWRSTFVNISSALLCYELGRQAEARRRLEETLPLLDELGETGWQPMVLALLGNVHLALGNLEEASVLLSQELPESESDPRGGLSSPFKWLGLGRLALERGEDREAVDYFHKAMVAGRESKNSEVPLEALLEVARVRNRVGDHEGAAELVAHILEQPTVGPITCAQARALRSEIADTLPFATLKSVESRGRKRKLDELITHVQAYAESLLPGERV